MLGEVPPGDPCVCLGSEIQAKRQERKRRSTANPAYSGLLEPEVSPLPVARPRLPLTTADAPSCPVCLQRKRLPSHYLDTSLLLTAPGEHTAHQSEQRGRS